VSKVVVTGRIPADAVDLLRAEHDVWAWEEDDPIPRDRLLAEVRGADALVTLLTERVDGELLDVGACSPTPRPTSRWRSC
jgi:glyoxylate reductase